MGRCNEPCKSCIRDGDKDEDIFSVVQDSSIKVTPRPAEESMGLSPFTTGTSESSFCKQAVTRKPFVVDVTLGVAAPLGMTISTDDADPSLLAIDAIWTPGLIYDWNKSHPEDMQVCVGDAITRVNDEVGTGREMLNFLCPLDRGTDG